jgi:hypothetical protein
MAMSTPAIALMIAIITLVIAAMMASMPWAMAEMMEPWKVLEHTMARETRSCETYHYDEW